MGRTWLIGLAASFLAAGCAPSLPPGPSMMVLPGNGKDFDSFALDDAICRQWALQQIGAVPQQASTNAEVSSAVAGTALGAATGAAIGAAAGDPAMGAAAGAGIGLLGGSAVGANQAAGAEWSLQRRYDIAYMQCMYVKGNQIPVQGGDSPASADSHATASARAATTCRKFAADSHAALARAARRSAPTCRKSTATSSWDELLGKLSTGKPRALHSCPRHHLTDGPSIGIWTKHQVDAECSTACYRSRRSPD